MAGRGGEKAKPRAARKSARERAGSEKTGSATPRTLDSFREEMLRDDPKFKRAWEALEAKRKIVAILLRLRAKAKLTQKELAERAGWQASFVSRLESFPREGDKIYMPDLVTLMRYAEVCGSNLGMVFGEAKSRGSAVHFTDSLALGDDRRFNQAVEAFSNTDVGVKNKVVRSVAKVETSS
jgi:transcriptional regulator with XRE-family HTH domain